MTMPLRDTPLTRADVDALATEADVGALGISSGAVPHEAIALLGYQRTKQVSAAARLAWENGDPAPMLTEALTRGEAIFRGALLETYREYLPLRAFLDARNFRPRTVIDIGCGTAITDLFLCRDYTPRVTLIDIEETEDQYHFWADQGSGHASLDAAVALLTDDGVPRDRITAINPRVEPEALKTVRGNLLFSFYSCGFHYPVDDYARMMTRTVERGGLVCLDLRQSYVRSQTGKLPRVLDSGEVHILYEDARSIRIALCLPQG